LAIIAINFATVPLAASPAEGLVSLGFAGLKGGSMAPLSPSKKLIETT